MSDTSIFEYTPQHFNNLTTSALISSSYAPVPFRRLPMSCLPVPVFLLPLSPCVWYIHTYMNVSRKYVSVNILYFWKNTTSVHHDVYFFESILYFWKYTTSVQHDVFHTILECSLTVSLSLSLSLSFSLSSLSLSLLYYICTSWHIPHYTRMLSHCDSVALSRTLYYICENILHLYSMTYSALY